jgi:hypothetical protein
MRHETPKRHHPRTRTQGIDVAHPPTRQVQVSRVTPALYDKHVRGARTHVGTLVENSEWAAYGEVGSGFDSGSGSGSGQGLGLGLGLGLAQALELARRGGWGGAV